MFVRYRALGVPTLLTVIALGLGTGCGSSSSTTATTSTDTSSATTSTTETTTPTDTTSTDTASSDTSTSSSETTTSESTATAAASVADLDAVCNQARDAYHSTEPSPSSGADPQTLQVKATGLLAAAAEKIRAAGATGLADALDRQVEAGKALAAAYSEGRVGNSESQALDEAGKATAAAAREAGSSVCEKLGGL